MNFFRDNSVTMRWFFGDGTPRDLAYASRVLDAMKADEAVVPGLWSLEVANVLARAESTGLVSEARSETFIGMLQQLDISVDPATSAQALAATLQLARGTRCPPTVPPIWNLRCGPAWRWRPWTRSCRKRRARPA